MHPPVLRSQPSSFLDRHSGCRRHLGRPLAGVPGVRGPLLPPRPNNAAAYGDPMKPRMEYWKVVPGAFKAMSSLETERRNTRGRRETEGEYGRNSTRRKPNSQDLLA